MDYYFEGIQRLDWGFGNPNKTAAFIAMLTVASWSACLVWKRLFWIMLPVTALCAVFLLQTVSRGGLVAALIGGLTVVLVLRPRWGWPRWVSVIVAVAGLWAYSSSLGISSRYVQGLGGKEDRSVSNRWLIYQAVPQMLLDAPQGWGAGNAPEAFQQWYQPEGRGETYLNLVNSHFTWLVEWGTGKRLLYSLGWVAVLILTFPQKDRSWWAIVFAVWLTFFVAAAFSSVAHHLWMWPFPLIGLLCVLIDRVWFRKGLNRYAMLGIPVVASLGYALLLGCSLFLPRQAPLHYDGENVIVGNAEASRKIAIIGSDKAILGNVLGHRLRVYVANNQDAMFVLSENITELQLSCDTVVLAGEIMNEIDLTALSNVVLLNPEMPTNDINDVSSPVKVLWGDFHSSHAWYSWQHLASKKHNISLEKIPGEGTYLESWLEHIN